MCSKNIIISSVVLVGVFLTTSECLRLPILKDQDGSINNKLEIEDDVDPGERLILTPLIEEGRTDEAKLKAAVGNIADFSGVTSYSGYFTVKKDDQSNSFFWFFPSEQNPEEAPVILWLQGGPGDSSLLGLFAENGPFEIGENSSIKRREHRWTKTHSVLYIDSPVGTGFSVTNGEFRSNQEQIANDLYEALKQFFTMFPDYKKNDFVVAGESYAGKYTTTIAYKIHQENPNATVKINLKAVAIDSGMVDPMNQHDYSDYVYQLGLVDSVKAASIKETEKAISDDITNQRWIDGLKKWGGLIGEINQSSGLNNNYNYLITKDVDAESKGWISTFFDRNDVRAAIHVGNTTYDNGDNVNGAMGEDYMKSNAPKLVELLNNYRVLIYNGQVDIIVPYPLTVNYLQKLQFDGSEEYKTAKREQWKVNDELAGYVKVAGKLTEVMVRKAGHMIAHDQPAWAYDLIYKFIRNQPLAS